MSLDTYGNDSPDVPRIHLNNLLVGLNLNLPYSHAMPTTANRRSEGNLWHQPHKGDGTVLFHFIHPDRPNEPVRTIAQLHQLDPAWERGSLFVEPKLRNLDDEIFDQGLYLGESYPNNDFRPAPGSPVIAAGVVLPPISTIPIGLRAAPAPMSVRCQLPAHRWASGSTTAWCFPRPGSPSPTPVPISSSPTPTGMDLNL